jgi:hypothetical protein
MLLTEGMLYYAENRKPIRNKKFRVVEATKWWLTNKGITKTRESGVGELKLRECTRGSLIFMDGPTHFEIWKKRLCCPWVWIVAGKYYDNKIKKKILYL